jgi:hypothetical protein
MAGREPRRVLNQGHGTIIPERDRAFAVSIRRTLLLVVAMIEDHFGLEPINKARKEGERAARVAR